MALDGISQRFLSLGVIAEDDDNILDKINALYCDDEGRPYVDIRIHKALIVHDPYPDPDGMDLLMAARGITSDPKNSNDSPNYMRPPEEIVPHRVSNDEVDPYEHLSAAEREEQIQKKETK